MSSLSSAHTSTVFPVLVFLCIIQSAQTLNALITRCLRIQCDFAGLPQVGMDSYVRAREQCQRIKRNARKNNNVATMEQSISTPSTISDILFIWKHQSEMEKGNETTEQKTNNYRYDFWKTRTTMWSGRFCHP